MSKETEYQKKRKAYVKRQYPLDGKTCRCGHVIYHVPYRGYRCGPGCDEAIPREGGAS